MQLPVPCASKRRRNFEQIRAIWRQFPQIGDNPARLAAIVHADAKTQQVALAVALVGQFMRQVANQKPAKPALRQISAAGHLATRQIPPRHRHPIILGADEQKTIAQRDPDRNVARKLGVGMLDDIVQHFGKNDFRCPENLNTWLTSDTDPTFCPLLRVFCKRA